ncbi:hypothetical protein A3Q56_08605 [Intoshia linei]|uniref:Uncharacterized protein n=1 Tax=Intoshia linei TaxID=1819745 RepID=A0A177AQN4_9BILA|nr:hypothetical protein A3Q56_08605 [Intoshia linei]
MNTRYTISKKIGVSPAEIVLGYDINRDNANRLSLKEAITSHKKIHNSRVKRNYDSHVQKSKFHTKFKPLLPHKNKQNPLYILKQKRHTVIPGKFKDYVTF